MRQWREKVPVGSVWNVPVEVVEAVVPTGQCDVKSPGSNVHIV